MNKKIKSHIYLAESILKRFSFQDKHKRYLINYIDIKTMQIKQETIRKFNRELEYYTYETEQKLKSNSEEKIGNIIAKLENHLKKNNTDFVLSKQDRNVLTKYLAYQWLRSDYLMQLIKDRLNLPLSIKLLKNTLIDEEDNINLISKLTSEMGIGILFNNTNNGYIINSATSVWNTNSKDYYIITIILTPNIAIRYCKKNSIKKILGLDNDYFVNIINDDNIVLNENINTLKATYNISPNFVVGRKKDLEILINNYQKN